MSVHAQRASSDPRSLLSAELQSQLYYLPSLNDIYQDCPVKVNPNYPPLKVLVEARIQELYPKEQAEELIRNDYALLTSMWWPRANLERLRICTFWMLWLFTWDDEIDQSTSELFADLAAANQFREETYHFCRFTLGVPDAETLKWHFEKKEKIPRRPIIRSMDLICEELKKVYNKDQIEVFVDEFYYYIDCQQREQRYKLAGIVPTVHQYMETRLGTSAVAFMLALNEYADSQTLPRWIMTHPKMGEIWHEVNLNISLANDMVSLRKEINHGDIDSIIPILIFNRHMSIDEAIADTYHKLEKNVARLNSVAADLAEIVRKRQPEYVEDVKFWIEGCRYHETANQLWSLKSGRYGLGDIPCDAEGGIFM